MCIIYDFYTFLVKIHGHGGHRRRARAGPGPGSGPGGPCALLPESGKGSSPAPVPPVAMYFHKKGIEIIDNTHL